MAAVVRPVTRPDIPALSRALAEAFDDDPVMSWMLPDASKRPAGLARLFAAEIRYHHLSGGGAELAESADGTIVGGALWDPPGRWKQSAFDSFLSLPTVARALGRYLRVGAEVSHALESAHPTEPHWYLATIGTSSAGRGGGYGKALLNSRLSRCDAEAAPAYLESSKHANIPYYERFGFEVTGEIVIPNGGPTLWKMWRNPR
ncbi:GNAT family N-acetyltransferase [Rhodococcus sp. TAF43]|uniref:GNAT family N-acetyltransferase n=1 Tax=unclassified Rhodococcus (in: high G+C Gram-positive bacteria) TaxID=192944 RepID=UPI001582E235|nr:GNAT family N-acetyltransferase [Rhodococcus sp. W8901]QKT12255.1 GNAT family N-acetyltransferase [Rhodococcus sp. W8901]